MARARNVMLWCEAFQATPAGSLPDDDDELAEAAGFGMDVDAFVAAKAEIMAPWVLCSDGRWYHPTVSEKVNEAWERTSQRRKADAERKRVSREKTDKSRVTGAHKDGQSRSKSTMSDVTDPNVTRDSGQTYTRAVTGQDRTGQEPSSLRSEGAASLDRWSEILSIEEPGKRAWTAAIFVLADQGAVADKSARSFLGKVRKETGFTDDELMEAAALVRSNGTMDPQPLLRQTLRGIVAKRGEQPAPQPTTAQADGQALAIFRKIVRDWQADPNDWPSSRGPTPDSGLCSFVPPEILREFGYGLVTDAVDVGLFE